VGEVRRGDRSPLQRHRQPPQRLRALPFTAQRVKQAWAEGPLIRMSRVRSCEQDLRSSLRFSSGRGVAKIHLAQKTAIAEARQVYTAKTASRDLHQAALRKAGAGGG